MFVIVNKFFLTGRFEGIVLWPFIFVRRKELKNDMMFMNHERIHIRQQLELLVVFFFVLYFLEYLYGLLRYRDSFLAYSRISFEREAYRNERNSDYLRNRKFWAFIKYY